MDLTIHRASQLLHSKVLGESKSETYRHSEPLILVRGTEPREQLQLKLLQDSPAGNETGVRSLSNSLYDTQLFFD